MARPLQTAPAAFALFAGLALWPCPAAEGEAERVLVLQDGQVLRPAAGGAHLAGPRGSGELSVSGDPAPGLLDGPTRAELAARLPGLLPAPAPAASSGVSPLERLVVVVDAGHGGQELGAKGVSGKREKGVVLDLALAIRDALERLPGLEVVLTRASDEHVPLWDRLTLAEQAGADLLVSVHANAFVRSSLTGVETFFHAVTASNAEARRVAEAENEADTRERPGSRDPVQSILADMHKAEALRDSSRFAHLVQEELVQALGFRNLGVQQADFVVLRSARVPSVLLELGFLTNRREERSLRSPEVQRKVGQALARAVTRYRELLARKRALAPAAEGSPGGAP